MPMTPERRRVAVLGGTFDPVHLAHLVAATGARDAIGADEAWLVPARAPALRDEPLAPPHLRLAMLETAVRATPGLRIVDVELRRPGVSFTIDTLEALRAGGPADEAWWVVGADAARHIHEWHRSDELLGMIRLAIVQRAGSPASPTRRRARWGSTASARRCSTSRRPTSAHPTCVVGWCEVSRSRGWCRRRWPTSSRRAGSIDPRRCDNGAG